MFDIRAFATTVCRPLLSGNESYVLSTHLEQPFVDISFLKITHMCYQHVRNIWNSISLTTAIRHEPYVSSKHLEPYVDNHSSVKSPRMC